LEPENASVHSKSKSITNNSQHSASLHSTVNPKAKRDLFRSQRPDDSFGSFDMTPLL
jgi:hypothetical protein